MNENKTLYFFQGLASILVVFIHSPFPGTLGTVVTAWARIAVPFFFMISGYFLFAYLDSEQFPQKNFQRIKRNGAITVIGLIIYFLIDVAKCILKRKSVWTFWERVFSLSNLVKFFALGIPATGGILWFMMALVYTYILLLILKTLFTRNSIKAWGIGAFIYMVLLGIVKIITSALNIHIGSIFLGSNWIYGNWITIGLPAILIGMSMRKLNEDRTWNNFSVPVVLAIMVICLTATSIEALILKQNLNIYLSYSIFTLIVDACIFILAQKEYFHRQNSMIKLGKYYSRDLYLWHPIIISMISTFVTKLQLEENTAIMYLQPVIVLAVSLLLCIVIYRVKKRITIW